MAFSHHKIQIGGEQTAGQAVSYLADPQSAGDYYTEGQRAPMIWAASERARRLLGLGEVVELWKVESLLRGQHPLTGQLLRRYGPTQTMVGGIDVTLSPAPKSFSVLWALSDDQLRDELETMVVQAAGGAIAVMAELAPLVRERVGPIVRPIKANDLVALHTLHTTARLSETKPRVPDPQLHVHSLLFADLREDGKLRAIDSLLILQHQKELDARASSSLAYLLEQRGFEIERKLIYGPGGHIKRVSWEVKGIPESLIQAMSGRSQEIADLARQYREETGRSPQGPGWERYVTGRRGPKSKLSAEQLRAAWTSETEEHGFASLQAAELKAEADARRSSWRERSTDGPDADQFRQEILRDICRVDAMVPMARLHALAEERAIGLVGPTQARRVLGDLFGSGDLLHLENGMVTTLEVVAQEQRAERALQRLLDAEPGQAATSEQLEREFKAREDEGRPFDPEQREAIALAVSGPRFISVSGPAGTGKGHASRAMVDVWKDQGRRVFALAVAGRTAQQAGADSGAMPFTLDGLQARAEHGIIELKRSDVLLVDEAAMIDHKRYAALLELAAKTETTVVQIGDDKQLSPVEAGGLWTVFHQLAEQKQLAAELRTVRRARNPAEAEAWTQLRHGNIEQGLNWYREQDRLRLYENRRDLLQGMVGDWWEHNRAGVMVVDSSNAERDTVNRMAQAKRLEAGELGAEQLEMASGRQLHVGDRVIFNEIHRFAPEERERRVENGTVATVVGLENRRPGLLEAERAHAPPTTAVLQLQEPMGSRAVTIDASAPVELGYGRHVSKSQGMTAVTADLAISEQTAQEQLYTMTSRSQEGSRIHALRSEVPETVYIINGAGGPSQIPEGAVPWQDLEAQLAQAQAQLDARETVSVREIAQQASRSSAKQAVHHLHATPAAAERDIEYLQQDRLNAASSREWKTKDRQLQSDRRELTDWQQQPLEKAAETRQTSEQIRQATRERIQARLDAARQQAEAASRNPVPKALPARTAKETAARTYAAERDSTRESLAIYQSMGRLDYAASPELRAVEIALAGGHDTIVTTDAKQAARVQGLLETASAGQAAQQPAQRPAAQPRVVQARELYQERVHARETWREQTAREHWHRPEPDVTERAVVILTDSQDRHSLSRSTSAVAQAHVVTNQPAPLEHQAISRTAQQISAQEAVQAHVHGQQQTAEVTEQLQHQSAQHSAQHVAEHAGAEHQGAER